MTDDKDKAPSPLTWKGNRVSPMLNKVGFVDASWVKKEDSTLPGTGIIEGSKRAVEKDTND
jgi:hypothetical protein